MVTHLCCVKMHMENSLSVICHSSGVLHSRQTTTYDRVGYACHSHPHSRRLGVQPLVTRLDLTLNNKDGLLVCLTDFTIRVLYFSEFI